MKTVNSIGDNEIISVQLQYILLLKQNVIMRIVSILGDNYTEN